MNALEKPDVRNFRGGGGNVGIIEARLAPPLYSTAEFDFFDRKVRQGRNDKTFHSTAGTEAKDIP